MILLTSDIAAMPQTILLASVAHRRQYTADTTLNHGILSDDRVSVATGHRLGSNSTFQGIGVRGGEGQFPLIFGSSAPINQINQINLGLQRRVSRVPGRKSERCVLRSGTWKSNQLHVSNQEQRVENRARSGHLISQ